MLRPDDDITDSVIQLQNCNAKGVLLVHTSDHLPVEQLNARPCGDIKIPVMLIARRLGEGLLRELKECSHTVKLTIVHDSSVQYDVSVPEYQPPDVRKANQMAFVDETRKISVAGKKFGFTKRMRKLLFASDGQPVVMCTDLETVGNNTFLLLDEYERHTREHSVSRSKLKTKLRKICSQLTKCMDKNYQQDLPYHCIMVFRLQSSLVKNDCEIFLLIQLRQCSYHLLGRFVVDAQEYIATAVWWKPGSCS
ncbi:uncharacterized protein LOC134177956 [Corticium candelabrum]|uniref:uncharacterized protein LOC134177956 n=1 Tax=Corticium candelabrum TaxID=121492 RepID=UPI002E2621C2|nr:uncharacterized protein LOC134177956 [Corticium candelabrum]